MRSRLKWKLWKWIDKRNKIPFWVMWLWPKTHWCGEMDYLLIMDNSEDCFCGYWERH